MYSTSRNDWSFCIVSNIGEFDGVEDAYEYCCIAVILSPADDMDDNLRSDDVPDNIKSDLDLVGFDMECELMEATFELKSDVDKKTFNIEIATNYLVSLGYTHASYLGN